MSNAAYVAITDAQMTALECAGVFECEPVDAEDPAATIRPAINGRRIAATDATCRAICDLSNGLDDLSRDERSDERRGWWSKDSRVLANLYGKMLRALPRPLDS